MSQRVLKFRAWDRQEETMFENIQNSTDFDKFIHLESFESMQFTGLLDKNGKEIYEGDVIQFTYALSGVQKIMDVRWKGTGFKPTRLSESNRGEMEIIGSIYENPSLLTNN